MKWFEVKWEEKKNYLKLFFGNKTYIVIEKLTVVKILKFKIYQNYFSKIEFKILYHFDARAIKTEPWCNLLNILVGRIFSGLKWFKTDKIRLIFLTNFFLSLIYQIRIGLKWKFWMVGDLVAFSHLSGIPLKLRGSFLSFPPPPSCTQERGGKEKKGKKRRRRKNKEEIFWVVSWADRAPARVRFFLRFDIVVCIIILLFPCWDSFGGFFL